MQSDQTLNMDKMSEGVEKVADCMQDKLQQGKRKLSDLGQNMADLSKEYARFTDHYVHENSWKAIGLGAVLGLAAGLLISRR